jgi:hypothetical protein
VTSPARGLAERARWFGPVALLTLGVGAGAVLGPGVHMARFDVVLAAPVRNDNALDGSSDRLADLAGITAKSVSGDLDGAATVSDVSLAGQGRLGWSVRQVNEGGQWTYWFPRPVLDVQIAGHDEAAVRRQVGEVVERIRADIAAREDAAGVAEDNRVRTLLAPPVPEVTYSDGDRIRAAAVVLALALLLGAAADHLGRRFGVAGAVRQFRRLRAAVLMARVGPGTPPA